MHRSVVELRDVAHSTKVCLFQTVVAAVDQANCAAPPAKRQKVDPVLAHEEDAPYALWWDLAPLQMGFTSSFEELLDTILHQCHMFKQWMTIQEKFERACLALGKQAGYRIAVLVLENAQLLDQDTSSWGRWMLLKQLIAAGGCATKVVCLHDQPHTVSTTIALPPPTRSIASLNVEEWNGEDNDDSATALDQDFSPSSNGFLSNDDFSVL
eukprot:TRINITY_DN561_c0_g1_i1.p1 TRINITY_DN561_c0_g1~~TRINITY_DN561_c0_g1_i1.p1  ORF type:complete len:211 (-),score=30.99 TRINITY_DN561_c0_g1_i1:327-959(-)